MDRPAARLAKHSKRISLPEYPTTVREEALEEHDAVMDLPRDPPAGWTAEVRVDGQPLYGVVWRHVKGASGNGWERIEIALPAGMLEAIAHKRHEFDLPRMVQACTTEFLQNVIEERIDEEYFK